VHDGSRRESPLEHFLEAKTPEFKPAFEEFLLELEDPRVEQDTRRIGER
jgi:hypothetical protein